MKTKQLTKTDKAKLFCNKYLFCVFSVELYDLPPLMRKRQKCTKNPKSVKNRLQNVP